MDMIPVEDEPFRNMTGEKHSRDEISNSVTSIVSTLVHASTSAVGTVCNVTLEAVAKVTKVVPMTTKASTAWHVSLSTDNVAAEGKDEEFNLMATIAAMTPTSWISNDGRDFYIGLALALGSSIFIAKKVPDSLTPGEVGHSYRDFFIGLSLALSSNVFIGASYIIKKKGLIKVRSRGASASQGGYAYLTEWLWWLGFLMMGLGEGSNFAAYIFAPATLVTPLGALSVLMAAIMASYVLKERLNLIGKVGCFLCMVGATIIVIHAPKEGEVESMEALAHKLIEPGFLVYSGIAIAVSLFLIFYCSPRWGQTNVLIYITICSLFGSLSVMACKGIGLALKETISGSNQFTNWITYFFIVAVVVCIGFEMAYLNRALDTFNTSIVTPIYYVFFTTYTIVASAILFKEWQKLGANDIIGNICGFLTIIGAIFLLHAFKDMDITLRSLHQKVKTNESTQDEAGNAYVTFGADTDSEEGAAAEKIPLRLNSTSTNTYVQS